MHLIALPRHQIETRPADYLDMVRAIAAPDPSEFKRFEKAFCDHIGCRHAIAVSSGRLAMHLILDAHEPQPGDEAIIPAFNLFAVIERFCQFGVVPRFVDIRRADLNIDPSCVERLIGPRTRFLVATHMFGHAAEMDRLVDIARQRDLVLIEDCAHAFGTLHGNRYAGTFGRAAIFSFSVLKLITTFGGGMIATNDDDLADRLRYRLACLQPRQPEPVALGRFLSCAAIDASTRTSLYSVATWPALRLMKLLRPGFDKNVLTEMPHAVRTFDPAAIAPMHPFQARLGARQLARADELIARRREVGRRLDRALGDIPGVQLLHSGPGSLWNGLYYGLLCDRPAELASYLFRHGIDSETSEYLNCADLPLYGEYFVDCPVAREVQSRILRIPNYPRLTARQVERIADRIRRFSPMRSSAKARQSIPLPPSQGGVYDSMPSVSRMNA